MGPVETAQAEAEAIPADLRRALVIWYRAYHHGDRMEELEAEKDLLRAVNRRITAMRELEA